MPQDTLYFVAASLFGCLFVGLAGFSPPAGNHNESVQRTVIGIPVQYLL
jgi:hypothetical protein